MMAKCPKLAQPVSLVALLVVDANAGTVAAVLSTPDERGTGTFGASSGIALAVYVTFGSQIRNPPVRCSRTARICSRTSAAPYFRPGGREKSCSQGTTAASVPSVCFENCRTDLLTIS